MPVARSRLPLLADARNGSSRRQGLRTLRAKLIVLDFQRRLAGLEPHYAASRHQLERASVVELGRPANGYFNRPAGEQHMLSGKQYPCTADIDRLPLSRFLIALLVQNTIADLALNAEAP